ncbi:hypothetical protein QQA44_00110 [Sneathia vaginalis]|nr:hypothetical protein [Sneathia vaginalis]MDK9581284.1 hypothetical protein [Sneathia vaginalis]
MFIEPQIKFIENSCTKDEKIEINIACILEKQMIYVEELNNIMKF